MSKFDKLTDSKEARRDRQRKRRAALNEVAQGIGYDTWTKLETAVIHDDVILTRAHVVDLQPNKEYYQKA